MSQSNDSGLNLDHLEALAKAAQISILRMGMNGRPNDYFALMNAMSPEAVLALIALARRAALANQPAPTVPAGDAGLIEFFERFGSAMDNDAWRELGYLVEAARDRIAHQPAQEQAEPPTFCESCDDLAGPSGVCQACIDFADGAAQQEPVAAPTHDLTEEDRQLVARGMERLRKGAAGECRLPPSGWHCTRTPGHDGPCAAEPVAAPQQAPVRPAGYITPGQFKRLALGQVAEILPVESGGQGKTAVYFASQNEPVPERLFRTDDFGVEWEVTPEQAKTIDAARAAQLDGGQEGSD